ncbi:MAG: thioredoxin domain-containing protein [Bacteroidota bacterium]
MKLDIFQRNVIDKSQDEAVLVLYWGTWCGTCHVVRQMLEEMENKDEIDCQYVSVDVGQSPEVIENTGVNRVPRIHLYHKGKVLADSAGTGSPFFMKKWLKAHIPDPRQEELMEIQSDKRDFPNAENEVKIEALLKEYPDFDDVKIALAWHQVLFQPEKCLDSIKHVVLGHKHWIEADDIRALAKLASISETEEGELEKELMRCKGALQMKQQEEAINHLVAAFKLKLKHRNDLLRELAIAFIHVFGKDHPWIKAHEKPFSIMARL